ncbi:unnamed protein product [Prorocentrum cordatum]|uniref:Component of oligomeric Golgi complex 7 n=1 Tax=Prorocentrum cordatum TaxID=2364126 RepID=A0ABN9V7D6_9DINO|nr:unnamed protein product [Polarella glacialis]
MSWDLWGWVQVVNTSQRWGSEVLAPGLASALGSLPGAGRDGAGHIAVPVPDARLEALARLERTRPVQATVEVAEAEGGVEDELAHAVGGALGAGGPPELSGRLLAFLRGSAAVVLAVPCPGGGGASPVAWLEAAEGALVASDLEALEQQTCKAGATGAAAELDLAKLGKALKGSKDPAVKRDAESLARDVVAPGLESLRARLRAGLPARGARPGLEGGAEAGGAPFPALDARFEELAKGWLNVVVTWRPLLLVADVPEAEAAGGSGAAAELAAHAGRRGLPCVAACLALERERVALLEEPDFFREYLASLGLAGEGADGAGGWRSQASEVVHRLPPLLNLLTYYTAGEKEAKVRTASCRRRARGEE